MLPVKAPFALLTLCVLKKIECSNPCPPPTSKEAMKSAVWFEVIPMVSVVVNTPMFTCKEMHNFGNVLFLRQMYTGCFTSF